MNFALGNHALGDGGHEPSLDAAGAIALDGMASIFTNILLAASGTIALTGTPSITTSITMADNGTITFQQVSVDLATSIRLASSGQLTLATTAILGNTLQASGTLRLVGNVWIEKKIPGTAVLSESQLRITSVTYQQISAERV